MSSPKKSAFIIGATGACGRYALKYALESPEFSKVTVIGRREVAYSGPGQEKLVQKVVNFDKLDEHKEAFSGHNVAFLALGTTRADAGSAEAFVKIDHDYVVESAKLFKEMNPDAVKDGHLLYISSGGSDANSSFLYPRTKGLVERDLIALGLPRTTILQPGMLNLPKGDERKQGPRATEKVAGLVLAPFYYVPWIKDRLGVDTPTVGRVMVKLATSPPDQESTVPSKSGSSGVVEYVSNKRILELGSSFE